jgi:AcrR family transcriptional regulator
MKRPEAGLRPFRCIIYTSRPAIAWTDDLLADLQREATDRNLSLAVTGRLVFLGDRFIQVLEAPGEVAMDLYRRICLDQRHAEVLLLLDRSLPERAFGSWSMDLVTAADLTGAQFDDLRARSAGRSQARGILAALRALEGAFASAGPRVAAQQGRAQATIDRVLDAGRTVFLRGGVPSTTMQAVAREANVSLNTVYRYFATTDEIARMFVRRWQLRQIANFATRLGEITLAQPEEMADAIIGHVIDTYARNDLIPQRVRTAALRDHHRIAYAELNDLAAMIVQALARNNLDTSDPGMRGRIAMALAGIGAQAKMAALHEPAQLRSSGFRRHGAQSLIDAMVSEAEAAGPAR